MAPGQVRIRGNHSIFLRATPLIKFKESFRLSHRTCANPHIPQGNTIHSLVACPQCYSSHCRLPNRLASHYSGQDPRDLFPGPLSHQHHRSFLLLPDARRSEPWRFFREADKPHSCVFARSNQSSKRRRFDQPTYDRGRKVLVCGISGEEKGRNLAGANDTLIMRAMASGRAESVSDQKTRNSYKIDGVDWNTLRGGI